MPHPKSRNYEWYCMADPGTTACFAVAFFAYLPWKERLFAVDEIYETDPIETALGNIGPRIIEKASELHVPLDQWTWMYDSAAAWFPVNFHERWPNSGIVWQPVEKKAGEKEENINVINELIECNDFLISTKCGNMIWELDNYKRNAKGQIPKKNDHQIDNVRYMIKHCGIIPNKRQGQDEPREPKVRLTTRMRRYISYEQDQNQGESFVGRILRKYHEEL